MFIMYDKSAVLEEIYTGNQKFEIIKSLMLTKALFI